MSVYKYKNKTLADKIREKAEVKPAEKKASKKASTSRGTKKKVEVTSNKKK